MRLTLRADNDGSPANELTAPEDPAGMSAVSAHTSLKTMSQVFPAVGQSIGLVAKK
jgi:hypothetical protein